MPRPVRAVEDMSRIVHIHNKVRCVFSVPGPVASFVNENTVVRAAAVMEHHLEKRLRRTVPVRQKKTFRLADMLGDWHAPPDYADACVRTLFLLRHFVVHLEGRYRPRSLWHWSKQHLLPGYREFVRLVPAAQVAHGEALCLSGEEVLKPLLQGCRDYWTTRRQGRAPRSATP